MGDIHLSGLSSQPQPNQKFNINNQVSETLNKNRIKALELNIEESKTLPTGNANYSTFNNLNISDKVNINQNNTRTGSIQSNTFQNLSKGTPAFIHITPTYGTQEEITVKGRVTEDNEAVGNSNAGDSKIKNFIKNFNIIRQEDLGNVFVDITFNGKTFKVQTDEEGYIDAKINGFGKVSPGYNKVYASISPGQKYSSNISSGTVAIQPKNDQSYGIVTDIDDTIQKSYVLDKVKAAKTLFLGNYKTQEEVAGTSELYQALDKRNDGAVDGDVYYVSGSPNQISTRIENFLNFNQFPEGSLDLKKMGFSANEDSPTEQINYKLGKIRTLFNTYPEKKFILFGDSGEKDPETYREIAREYPGRVIATYINNVTDDSKISPRYAGMFLTNNTSESAKDLLQKGFINTSDYLTVNKEILQNH